MSWDVSSSYETSIEIYDNCEHKTCVWVCWQGGKCHNKAIKTKGLACLICDLISIPENVSRFMSSYVSIATRCEIDNFSFRTSLFVSRETSTISSSLWVCARVEFLSSWVCWLLTFHSCWLRSETYFFVLSIPEKFFAAHSFHFHFLLHQHHIHSHLAQFSRRSMWTMSMQRWILIRPGKL